MRSIGPIAVALLAGWASMAWANAETIQPTGILRDVEFEQRLNTRIPLDLSFRDESGKAVQLQDYFGKKPVILSLAYYECPMLCTLVLNGLISALRVIPFTPGKEFEIVTVSFNPQESPELAAAKKANYLKEFNRPGAGAGWHFLTGDEASIRTLTETVGFKYAWDPATKQYAHAAGIMVVTPEGRLSRYFYGVEFSPRDLRLGLVEAAEGKIGNLVDQFLLYCYQYDPATGKYSTAALLSIRIGGIVTVVLLASFILFMLRRERRGQGGAGGLHLGGRIGHQA